MKNEYNTPELEIVSFTMYGILSDTLHNSFEHGGENTGWSFNDNDDDDDEFGELLP